MQNNDKKIQKTETKTNLSNNEILLRRIEKLEVVLFLIVNALRQTGISEGFLKQVESILSTKENK